ncbi:MAG: transporter substrate-binding domain-containing protein [Prevotella sp.]|nr:transporter substrate-binding domain-containing protein [Prevotella sp.]
MRQAKNIRLKSVVLLLAASFSFFTVSAQTVFSRAYTQEAPLVYEDCWDLWPYAFLNDQGEPEGFNIDLIRLLMDELDIPYEIRLKPQQEAFEDLKSGKSDLTLGLAVGFHDAFGLYGKNAITLFTQSVASAKNNPSTIKAFRDLGKDGVTVIVNDSSLCHHLMIDYGWGGHAVPKGDMREAIQQVSTNEQGQIVWNTLSLKWLISRYHLDNLLLTPVNMPHGEYKFMSNDQALLDRLDEVYSRLYTEERIAPIQTKWFYPEHEEGPTPIWVWLLDSLSLLIIILAVFYFAYYLLQTRRTRRKNKLLNQRLALILQTSQVRIWTYDIARQEFSWRNENGQVAYTYSMDEFVQRYDEEGLKQLKGAIDQLSGHVQAHKGYDEEEVTLELKAKDVEGGDRELHDFVIVLSVLTRDKDNKPTVIVGTKKDVTRERQQQRKENERNLRYWSIFYTPMVGVLLFDKKGYLVNINPYACDMFHCNSDEIIREHVRLNDCFDCEITDLEEADGFCATQIIDFHRLSPEERRVKSMHHNGKLVCEYRIMTVHGDGGELLGVFVICRDTSSSAVSVEQLNQSRERVENAARTCLEYERLIDCVAGYDDVRLVVYKPQSHTLTILNGGEKVVHQLTQTRCMTLVDSQSKGIAMHTLNDMDARAEREFRVTIGTILRVKGNKKLELQFSLSPRHDKEGTVVSYEGILCDISTLYDIKCRLTEEKKKVMEVEDTKNSFLKNMVQEIRNPLETMIDSVQKIGEEKAVKDEEHLYQGILENSNYLLHLIDNVLYLSRLEAGMVEISHSVQDIALLFDALCEQGWGMYKNAKTNYVVENPYEQLLVDVDVTNLGNVIQQLTANAAQHTTSGTVRARCEFIGRRLMISIDDTGDGIDPEELKRIMETAAGSQRNTKGLGLAISRELVRQMGGKMEIVSEVGAGTTVYIMIHCNVLHIKRKKQG